MRTISNKLGSLSSERKRADYDLGDARPESKNQAALAIAMSKEVLKTIDEMVAASQEERDLIAAELHKYFTIKQSSAFILRSGTSFV